MHRVRSLIAAALALSLAGSAAAKDLSARLDAALRNRALRDARIGVLVVAQQDGRVLYERGPDRALTPASNLKILTAIAALSAFGPAHRFVTEVFADAPPDAEARAHPSISRRPRSPALAPPFNREPGIALWKPRGGAHRRGGGHRGVATRRERRFTPRLRSGRFIEPDAGPQEGGRVGLGPEELRETVRGDSPQDEDAVSRCDRSIGAYRGAG